MARVKQKPDFDKIDVGLNPLINGLEIAVTKKISRVINKYDNWDTKENDWEATPYTKVFQVEDAVSQIVDLPIRCKEMYLWLIHAISSGKDYIWIDKVAYMNKMGIKSINTYKEAVNGLCKNLYIYPHADLKDVYWINPHFFFKGSRISKYPRKIKVVHEIKEK